ncbi:MAG TPA: triple tyrosine motif-containing protein, partial [Saprospiraceae bacterium]|nr:triple tyrosine motif-containing protein [Saprospiraceae bacterium]
FFELEGSVYVRDTEQGLCFWNGQELELVPEGAPFKDTLIVAILPYQEEQALLVTAENGLFLMDDGSIRPWKAAVSNFLEEYRVYCAARVSDGLYALGTITNGLLLMDQEGKAVAHLNKLYGLQNNTVLCIYEDLLQNLWLGLDNGLDYVELSAPFSIIGSKQGVEGTGYASIVHDDNLFLGTNQGLFHTRWTLGVDPFHPPLFERVEGANGQVWSLVEAGGQLMVCHHEGLFFYQNGKVFPVGGVKGAWKFLELEKHPNYAILGTYSGFYLFKKRTASKREAAWELVKRLQGFDESARIFEEDEEGNIWVSHAYKGLYKIELDMERLAIGRTQLYNSKQGLPTDLYIGVVKIRGKLVFTTVKGVYSFYREKGCFIEDSELSPVIGKGKSVHALLEDELKNIWFSADEEFGVLEVEEKGLFNEVNKRYFNALQEELVDGFEHVFAFGRQSVFIASERGFIQYTPLSKPPKAYPFQALIRSVLQLNGEEKQIQGGKLVWEKEGSDNRPPAVFSYRNNSFRFSFAAPFFEEHEAVQYRYRLEGYDLSWSSWASKAEKDYTNLPHGKYTFWVEARNAYAQRSTKAAYRLTIRPPWYLTVLAKILYALLGIAFVFGAFHYTGQRIEKQRKALLLAQEMELKQQEEAHRQQVAQSEAEIIRLRNEKLRTDVQHKTSKLASATMHLVQKGEILLEIKN